MAHIILSFLFYNFLILIFYSHYKRGHYYVKKSNWILYILLFIAFGTYGGGEGDYLQYKEAVESIHSLADVLYYNSMEIQYYYLAYLLDGNYNLWRLIIFSIQFLGLGWFLNKARLNTYPVLIAFTSLFLVTSVYGRVYWGVIYFFIGFYFLVEKKNPLYLLVVALCYVSHTSNLLLVALLPLGFIELRKWHLVLIILLFSTITAAFNDYFNLFLESGGVEGADYINGKVDTYSSSTSMYVHSFLGDSIGEKLVFLLRHVPLLIMLIQILSLFIGSNNRFETIDKPFRRIINVYLGLILASLVFLFADLNNGTYFYRVLAMTFFPITILLPYLVKNHYIKKRAFNYYIFLFLFATEVNYLKDIYYAYVAGI